jgi:hypothetical protein
VGTGPYGAGALGRGDAEYVIAERPRTIHPIVVTLKRRFGIFFMSILLTRVSNGQSKI